MRARLVQLEDDRPVASTHLAVDDVVIGRDASADLVLDHERISRRHALIACTEEGYLLSDLGSSNGTRVNGEWVTDPVLLQDGDVIELGDALNIAFEAEGSAARLIVRAALIGAAVTASLVLLIWLWPSDDSVMQEATALAASGVTAYQRSDPATAKAKLNAALGLLFAKGRLDDVPRLRAREEGLRRLGARLDGSVNLQALYRSAVEESRISRPAPVQPIRGPCRLDRLAAADLDVCIRERAEQVLYELWQDPREIPDDFYHAVNSQLRLLLKHRRDWVEGSLERGKLYTPMLTKELEAAHMPSLLHYLAMIESGYVADIRSPAGARGMWQFMPSTARGYGLKVTAGRDERTAPEKATRAAARYLRDLAFEFGGDAMLLAIASYNKGENGIRRALKKLDDPHTDRSYWTLVERDLLPKETRDYVPRFVAAAVLGEAGIPPRYALVGR